jgi:D-serine deaminase-like pyridoxal phosphate-dependent protein
MIDVETPALLLYRDVMERNLTQMADRARRLGVVLRPHIKTHKCLELGRRQVAHGAKGVTVSALFEAEAFARGGFTDLTWAFPLDPTHIPHVKRIADGGVTLRVVLDDLQTARAVSGTGFHVWLKVDCGYHRAGVDPSSRYGLDVARELGAERGLTFDGILSHSGHAYRTRNRNEAAQIAEQERQVMSWFAELLRKDGLPVRGVSVGSTPAMVAAKGLTGVTEARPGNYIFYDRTMVLIGCCEPQDVAVSVLATVVSHQPGASHFVIDAGALSLSKDLGPTNLGLEPVFGEVKGHPELTVASVSQEHGVIRAAAPAAIAGKFKVGQQLEIMPNHSCLTEAHFDEYVVIEGGRVMDRWHIERGR